MVLPAVAALIATSMIPVAAAAESPRTVCRITDDRLNEISGLVADGDGYVVVNDGADDPDGRRVFFLNKRCKVTRTVAYPSRPRDTEDLARAADGTIWVGDIGDNGNSRETIGLWRLAPGARKPTLFRLSYPDGARDAEALLVSGDGTPVVITKDPVTAGVYVPAEPLRDDGTTPMKRAGDVPIPVTATSNPFGFAGRLVITGAAASPDGTRVALRTYSDVFEFEVTEGDVVKAVTGGSARTTALPDEPQGESIAYSADGSALLTVSEGRDVPILSYPLSTPAPAPSIEPSPSPSVAPSVVPSAAAASPVAASSFPIGAVAAGLAMIVAGGVTGLLIARRRRS
ncbi:hypothetical protein AB0C07_38015 [Actinoplanes missouriensis]|uniref:hypothetical protein n=1 Tax=Actinoplanes missouriensis TaxID=1866 RepID=UPI0033C9101B